MPDYLVQAALKNPSGLQADSVVNTWSVNATSVINLQTAVDALVTFYQTVDQYLGAYLNGELNIKAYNRADLPPRQTVINQTTSGMTFGGQTLPQEVALCVSFQGPKASGVPQARRRGRVYLGPLAESGVTSTGRISATVQNGIASAAAAFLLASDTDPNWSWQVWSTRNSSGVMVVDGWVDDAYDTQRSRGLRATTRATFT